LVAAGSETRAERMAGSETRAERLPLCHFATLPLEIMTIEIAVLIAALQQPSAAERVEAARILCQAGAEANSAAIALVGAVGDDEDEVRQWASAALEELGPPRPEDLEKLSQFLGKPQSDRAYWAATLIGRLGPEGLPALAALESAVRSQKSTHVREQATWAIGQIGPEAHAAEATLREAATSKEPRLRRLAEAALESTKKPPPNQ